MDTDKKSVNAEMEEKEEFNQREYIKQWAKENTERINLVVRKGEREKIRQQANSRGYSSTSAYLKDLIQKDMKKDSSE